MAFCFCSSVASAFHFSATTCSTVLGCPYWFCPTATPARKTSEAVTIPNRVRRDRLIALYLRSYVKVPILVPAKHSTGKGSKPQRRKGRRDTAEDGTNAGSRSTNKP